MKYKYEIISFDTVFYSGENKCVIRIEADITLENGDIIPYIETIWCTSTHEEVIKKSQVRLLNKCIKDCIEIGTKYSR